MAAMEANIEYSRQLQSRWERVTELAEFTERCAASVQDLLTRLGWSLGLGLDLDPSNPEPPAGGPLEPMAICPLDAGHRVPKSSLEKHVTSCRLRKLGYSKEEEDKMYDSSFFYEKFLLPTLKVDKELQAQIIQKARNDAPVGKEERLFCQSDYSSAPCEVPQNHKRFVCDLTPADRLAIYEYVVQETNQQKTRACSVENDSDLYVDLAAKLSRDEEQKEPKSHLEILAEMRDYKRRRQSYRAKNVHITKKSYTEIIRDVINVHMDELSKYWKNQNESDHSEEHEEPSPSISSKTSTSRRKRSDDRRSPSVESRLSTGSSKAVDRVTRRKNRSRSPHDQRNPERGRERDGRKKRERKHHSRDEDRNHSHKRRK
ncbi:U11/U12 small nuclear ribonucleoprotein 48 kDa protein isoform X1 [Callorhinchus milii]|uniref:U11/U12 small nuclear ribonucleoprotein 48 kDa protein isoform X1 n=1 Tax=Callorhinchus milii TaxID=7868 RepID=UPI001C3FAC4B|nr:U11/U12 small nuclear ribonucleoprotein 48 kDa protein isoform X1 [Callorhinchus milii]